MRILASGYVSEYTGIGIIQKNLYPALSAMGHDLTLTRSRDLAEHRGSRVMALINALSIKANSEFDVFLSLVPPYPLGIAIPSLAFVHDLRWMRTRSGLSRQYRSWDLRRTVGNSRALISISDRTKKDLIAFDKRADGKTIALKLGPGQASPHFVEEHATNDILIMGAAKHKRNEVAAELIKKLPEAWYGKIVGINIDRSIRADLESTIGASRCEWFEKISPELLWSLYQRCKFSIQLSVEEGFGLPYLEAMSGGATIIAIKQPLTLELMAGGAILIEDTDPAEMARQVIDAQLPSVASRKGVLLNFSWKDFALNVAAEIRKNLGSSAPN